MSLVCNQAEDNKSHFVFLPISSQFCVDAGSSYTACKTNRQADRTGFENGFHKCITCLDGKALLDIDGEKDVN